jgi:hypothetical protein
MFQLESSLEGMNIVNVLLRRRNAQSCNRATPALIPGRCGVIVPSSLSSVGGSTTVNRPAHCQITFARARPEESASNVVCPQSGFASGAPLRSVLIPCSDGLSVVLPDEMRMWSPSALVFGIASYSWAGRGLTVPRHFCAYVLTPTPLNLSRHPLYKNLGNNDHTYLVVP